MELLSLLALTFVPIFVAIDPPFLIPMYLSMCDGMTPPQKAKLASSAVLIAFAVAGLFIISGGTLLASIGITENDFRIAGGLVLLVIGIGLSTGSGSDKKDAHGESESGIVPLGIPLIVGPSVLTTVTVLSRTYGMIATFVSLALNLVLTWMLLKHSEWLLRRIGKPLIQAVSKVAALLLVGIAVAMIRGGLKEMLQGIW